MLFSLGQRTRLDLSVQHDRNPVYVQLSDGAVRNNYTVKLRNMETRPRDVELLVAGLPGAQVWASGGKREAAGRRLDLSLAPNSVTRLQVFIVAPGEGPARQEFTISTRGKDGDEKGDSDDVVFERPEGRR